MNPTGQPLLAPSNSPASDEGAAKSGSNVLAQSPLADWTEERVAPPEEALAVGVLTQAAYDLRRFRGARGGIDRELYLDAYTWIIANEFSWPFSFVNVCGSLGICPETMRAELLADASLGWFGHWVRMGERASRLLRKSLVNIFRSERWNEAKPPVNNRPSSPYATT